MLLAVLFVGASVVGMAISSGLVLEAVVLVMLQRVFIGRRSDGDTNRSGTVRNRIVDRLGDFFRRWTVPSGRFLARDRIAPAAGNHARNQEGQSSHGGGSHVRLLHWRQGFSGEPFLTRRT